MSEQIDISRKVWMKDGTPVTDLEMRGIGQWPISSNEQGYTWTLEGIQSSSLNPSVLDLTHDEPPPPANVAPAYPPKWASNPELASLEEPATMTYAQPDMVNHPPHYTSGGIECLDAIQAMLTPEEWRGYLKGQIVKYTWRERMKGGQEDIGKAGFYLAKLKGDKA